MNFSIKDFFIKCETQLPADLFTFTEEILNGKIHFLCSVRNNLDFAQTVCLSLLSKYNLV